MADIPMDRLRQPVEAVTWKKKAEIEVRKSTESEIKLFRPIIKKVGGELDGAVGLPVESRSKALRNAFDFCNAQKWRVMAVDGVREEKFSLW